jgi:hypothetical protein
VKPITIQGAVRAAAKAALQTEDDAMGGSGSVARLRGDRVLVGAAAGSDADQ